MKGWTCNTVNSTFSMASLGSSTQFKIDPFSRLPAELRLKIFAFTDLVARDRRGRKTGVHVYDGELSDPTAHFLYRHDRLHCSCPAKFPVELLNSCNPYYAEVLQVLFSQNRIILAGSLVKMLAFLRVHRQGLHGIHELDFQFDHDVIKEWTETNTMSAEWEGLITFARQNLRLSNLTLSLDAWSPIPTFEEQQMMDIDEAGYRLDAYKMIIKPLRGLGEIGLKRFYVYWGCYHSYEVEAEKEVMGEDYEAEGKIPISRREPSDPHWDFREEQETRPKNEKMM